MNFETLLTKNQITKIACHSCGQKMDISDLEPFSEVKCPKCAELIIIPFQFKNFLLEEPIAHGRISTSYRALDTTLNREVAIKIFNKDICQNTKKIEAFRPILQKVASINNQSIVSIFSTGNIDDRIYIVEEFMQNGALTDSQFLNTEEINLKEVIKIGKELAQAMNVIHAYGIIFGDLSPNDIFMDTLGQLKISDIGLYELRKYASTTCQKLPSSYYQSPEANGDQMLSTSSDIYSLGVIIYQLSTGVIPFYNPSFEITKKLQNEQVKEPKELNPQIPETLNNLIIRMLEHAPSKRVESMNEVFKILNTIKFSKFNQSVNPNTVAQKKIAQVNELKKNIKDVKAGNLKSIILIVSAIIVALLAVYTDYIRGKNSVLFGEGRKTEKETTSQPKIKIKQPEKIGASFFFTLNSSVGKINKTSGKINKTSGKINKASDEIKNIRPKISDYDFCKSLKSLNKYVEHFEDEGQKKVEKARIARLIQCKSELTALLFRNPWCPEKNNKIKIKTENGLKEEDCISVMANDEEIIINKNNGKALKVSWNKLPITQIIIFYEYYLKQRVEFFKAGVGASKGLKKEAIETAIRAMLLSDWYNRKADSLKFAKIIISLDKSYRQKLEPFVPYLAGKM